MCLFVGEGPDKSMRQRENINDTIATYEDKLRKMGLAQVSEVRAEFKAGTNESGNWLVKSLIALVHV